MRVAVGMAVGGALLTGLLVMRLLAPFRTLLRGIERLQRGEFGARLPPQKVAEFDRLSTALNDTAAALQDARAVRAELTRRLFTLQESERRALAADPASSADVTLPGRTPSATLLPAAEGDERGQAGRRTTGSARTPPCARATTATPRACPAGPPRRRRIPPRRRARARPNR